MTTSFTKDAAEEADLLAERTKQEFNNASSGYEPGTAQGDGGDRPDDPALDHKRKDILSSEAAKEGGLGDGPEANFVANEALVELGLDEELGFDQGLELGR